MRYGSILRHTAILALSFVMLVAMSGCVSTSSEPVGIQKPTPAGGSAGQWEPGVAGKVTLYFFGTSD